jgi:hypothetical protein
MKTRCALPRINRFTQCPPRHLLVSGLPTSLDSGHLDPFSVPTIYLTYCGPHFLSAFFVFHCIYSHYWALILHRLGYWLYFGTRGRERIRSRWAANVCSSTTEYDDSNCRIMLLAGDSRLIYYSVVFLFLFSVFCFPLTPLLS